MASYKNNGGDLVFPTIVDADGNVLTVTAGASFEAPEGLVADGIVAVKVSKTTAVKDEPDA